MPVIVMGTAWLLAGGALEYGTQIVQTAADRDWVSGTDDQPSNLNVMLRCPVTCADVAVADTGIFKGQNRLREGLLKCLIFLEKTPKTTR